jgi:ubiquinone/menaquinone biosynthesis C-methylase UbiE
LLTIFCYQIDLFICLIYPKHKIINSLKHLKKAQLDKKYWDNYDHQHGKDTKSTEPSSFAQFCLDNFFTDKKLNIVELGSGNGRDAIFFAHHGHDVVAIDQSTTALDIKKKSLDAKLNLLLKAQALDFTKEDYTQYEKIDIFYSRFTLHSITKSEEVSLLPNIFRALTSNGLFCIEVRTTKDPLFGIGESCGDNIFIFDNHKRRFIDSNVFRKQVADLGFKEIYFIEENNLSIYKNDNPVLMRIILKK